MDPRLQAGEVGPSWEAFACGYQASWAFCLGSCRALAPLFRMQTAMSSSSRPFGLMGAAWKHLGARNPQGLNLNHEGALKP